MSEDGESIRDRLKNQGEETLGKIAQDLLENPLVNKAITGAFDAREKAVHAQEIAMGALNLPSAADFERITRRVRTVSQRVETIEDSLDRIEERLSAIVDQLSTAGQASSKSRNQAGRSKKAS